MHQQLCKTVYLQTVKYDFAADLKGWPHLTVKRFWAVYTIKEQSKTMMATFVLKAFRVDQMTVAGWGEDHFEQSLIN